MLVVKNKSISFLWEKKILLYWKHGHLVTWLQTKNSDVVVICSLYRCFKCSPGHSRIRNCSNFSPRHNTSNVLFLFYKRNYFRNVNDQTNTQRTARTSCFSALQSRKVKCAPKIFLMNWLFEKWIRLSFPYLVSNILRELLCIWS